MDVLTMLPALTLMEVMSVHAMLGSLEMASPVQVNQLYHFLCIRTVIILQTYTLTCV